MSIVKKNKNSWTLIKRNINQLKKKIPSKIENFLINYSIGKTSKKVIRSLIVKSKPRKIIRCREWY